MEQLLFLDCVWWTDLFPQPLGYYAARRLWKVEGRKCTGKWKGVRLCKGCGSIRSSGKAVGIVDFGSSEKNCVFYAVAGHC